MTQMEGGNAKRSGVLDKDNLGCWIGDGDVQLRYNVVVSLLLMLVRKDNKMCVVWCGVWTGLFMALQPRIIGCGGKRACIGMGIRFICGPIAMSAASLGVGLRGVKLHVAIVQVLSLFTLFSLFFLLNG